MKKRLWLWLSPPILILAVLGVYRFRADACAQRKAEAEAEAVAIQQELRSLAGQYQADITERRNRLLTDFTARTDPDFAAALTAVPGCVAQLSSMRACVKLCYKGAKDKLRGTRDLPDAVQVVLERPILLPCVRAEAAARDLLENYRLDLERRRNRYLVDVAAAGGDSAARPGGLSETGRIEWEQAMERAFGTAAEIPVGTAFGALGVGMEAVFLKETVRVVGGVLGKSIAKTCVAVSSSVVCAAADGPIPVGDAIGAVIAVGGLTWTAYDIHTARRTLPGKLSTELRDGVAGLQKTLKNEVETVSLALAQSCLSADAKSVDATEK